MLTGLSLAVLTGGLPHGPPARAELGPGQCYNSVPDREERFENLSPLAGDQPHRGEVFATLELPGVATYSQSEFLATEGCKAQLALHSHVPEPFLWVLYAGPSEREWAEGDRLIVCLAVTKSENSRSIRD